MFHRITTLGCSFGKMRLCERHPQRVEWRFKRAKCAEHGRSWKPDLLRKLNLVDGKYVALKNLSYAVNN